MRSTSEKVATEAQAAAPPPRQWHRLSAAEFYVYVVAFLCGVSMMMPVNAVFSAPSYITTYYLYATHNPDFVPSMTNFWSNVMTYYNLIGLVTCLVMEPLTLLKGFRRIPMLVRLLGGLCILILEIIVLMAVPARGTNEGGAVAAICMAGFIGGFGKSIFESTVYGMFSAFPPTFMALSCRSSPARLPASTLLLTPPRSPKCRRAKLLKRSMTRATKVVA
ncbi:putative Nucleoside transporter 1 [Leptomonas pyrrhocoris]|uniref:Putative Nucleoside transporter 1 n=1 Tax=Leptomonas pyrrhocoris TaxID=157538 RepID=A0A0M9FSD0_LEPPY|nr:putative Nucleoside transporter 1 [Leptomonas pyrrhocoris]XP_015653514.1 putative Nucleoside transporter 1 [Leptomonas pyrrhocoris]KPA75074.1 putative Nucleoside transporter 1 [Leptomonas pyrrhocoris]KPA75075.1 putative Nucleoside transporter 1 [Leptomonas pyrrhocoris]|eukprot:XP_015653513.1 putative Nucleoside transporter 1 [Leptomonas pyrrhocoris]